MRLNWLTVMAIPILILFFGIGASPMEADCQELMEKVSSILYDKSGGNLSGNDCNAIAQIITDCHLNSGIRPEVVLAIIEAESNFSPRAISSAGAIGLMQIIPRTGAKFYDGNRVDIRSHLSHATNNVRIGINYLVYLKEKVGEEKYIKAYLAGEGGNLNGSHCRRYHNKIQKLANSYSQLIWNSEGRT